MTEVIRSAAMNLASRKFTLVFFFSWIASIALFTKHLSGQEWLTAVGLLVGIYVTGNVTQAIGISKQTITTK